MIDKIDEHLNHRSLVGIVANPASGKDIRRLVAQGAVFDNNEKGNILKRILLALDAIGVEEASMMPDYYGLAEQALDGLHLSSLRASILDMKVLATEEDSTEAGRRFNEMGAGSIIVLGGDGTNRVVAKGCGKVPLISISTGTNNVFSTMIEGTVAGLAAGLLARRLVDLASVTYQAKRIDISLNQKWIDMALVDVVACCDLWIGSRAIWDPTHVQEIVLAQAVPGSIGMSSIGASLQPVTLHDQFGLYVAVGKGQGSVLAPVAPGLVAQVDVREHRFLPFGEEITLNPEVCTIALDGERSIEVYPGQTISVCVTNDGPYVVNVSNCLAEATRLGVFSR